VVGDEVVELAGDVTALLLGSAPGLLVALSWAERRNPDRSSGFGHGARLDRPCNRFRGAP